MLVVLLAACSEGERKPETQELPADSVAAPAADMAGAGFSLDILSGQSAVDSATTHAALLEQFGRKNLTVEKRIFSEGLLEYTCTALFPETDNELVVVWGNGEEKRSPLWVDLYWTESKWHTSYGLYVGMPLDSLRRLNNTEFLLNGFDWDYGGIIHDWQGGRLAPLKERFVIRLGYDYPGANYTEDSRWPEVIGEVVVNSGDPFLEKINTHIAAIRIYITGAP